MAEYFSATTANAEEGAGFFSRLFFIYVQPILSRGWREPLTTDSVYEVASRDEADKVSQRFQSIWSTESAQKKPSLRKAVTSFLGSYFLLAGLWKLVWDVLRFVSPLMINQILKFLSKQDEPWYNGLVFVGILIANEVVQTVFLHRYFHKGVRSAMHCRTALVTAVYRKSLRLSNASRQQFTSGEIVNLMSVDAGRFATIIPYLHMLWSSPLQFLIALIALYSLLGWPIFAGVSATIIFIPLNLIFVRKTERWTEDLMKTKDERVRLLSENLQAMKTVKFFAWEKSVEEKVTEIRDKEVKQLRKVRLLESVTDFFWYGTPVIITVITFAVYASTGKPLDVSLIFTALVLFNILKSPLYMLPWVIGTVVSTKVSLHRLEKFLLSEELSPEGTERDFEEAIENVYYFNDEMLTTEDDDERLSDANSPAPASIRRDSFKRAASELGLAGVAKSDRDYLTPIIPARKSSVLMDQIALNISQASFAWDNSSVDILRNIDLEVPKGSLVIVIGQVGSGKSSLMSAALGEMHRTRGSTELQGTVAYSAQNPWIINATVKENILMGKPYEPKKFKAIVDACGLGPDLKILPGGKNCEIGEKGVSLSGGQKSRISLARCLYSGADNYFFDDPLSALDVHVGRHAFKHAIVNYLKKSTRILVTHHYYTLPAADLVVIMKDGEIAQKGTYKELIAAGVNLNAYLEEEEQHKDDVQTKEKQQINANANTNDINNEEEEEDEEEQHRFMTEEERNVGKIKFGVYKSYFQLMGRFKFIAVFVCVLLVQTSYIVKDWWLGIWSSNETDPDMDNTSLRTFLFSYSGIAFLGALFLLIEEVTFALGSVKAAGRIHREMLHSILRTPLSFFDTTPVGRILNRFSKDQETVDSQLPASIMDFMMSFVTVISVVILLCVAAPLFTIFVIPIAILYTYIQRYYIKTSRELQRLDAITTSPIYAHFSATLNGVQTIRAFGFQKQFIKENERRINSNNKVYFPQMEVNRWLAQRLEMCGTMILSLTALFGVATRSWADPTLIGLALSYASSITDSLTWLVRYMTALENNMNSVERIRHYTTNLKHEALMNIPEEDPKDNWPREGKIDFRELILHYRPELPPALNGVTCTIKGGEHVGIVGRTGAGKSSIMYSLFRLQEPSGGYIMIDDIDISKIGLEVLRSNLSIIPQDPTIFSGTIRGNLDPFEQYDDDELWRVLERVHIKNKIQSLPDLLYTRVAENGENFSLGERQLLCLARALCRRNKIILMDEATAQIDTETDSLIQQTITEEFKNCTVITIAHRLETIVEYDKIIVMEAGRIVEYGSPKELAANPDSVFANMLSRASSGKLTNNNDADSTNSTSSSDNNNNTKPIRPKPKSFKIFTAHPKTEKNEKNSTIENTLDNIINVDDTYDMA